MFESSSLRAVPDDQPMRVVRGDTVFPLEAGPAWRVFERVGHTESFVTIVSGAPLLMAVTDAQYAAWKGRQFFGRPAVLS